MVKYKKKLDEDIRCQFEYGLPGVYGPHYFSVIVKLFQIMLKM